MNRTPGNEEDYTTRDESVKPSNANVYHIPFEKDELPLDQSGWATFTREYVNNLIPDIPDGIVYMLQQATVDNHYLIRLTVPLRLSSAVAAVETTGLEASFTEPEHPYLDGHAFIIPATTQLMDTGALIEPQSACDNPGYMWQIASMLRDHLPSAPPESLDITNWTSVSTDDDTGAAVIQWQNPHETRDTEEDK